MALTLSLAAAAVCLVVVYLAARAALAVVRFRRYELAIPGPPSLPVLGNTLSVVFEKHEDLLGAIHKLWAQRRDLSRASGLHYLFVFVSKPEDFAVVLRRKDLQDKSHFYYDIMSEVTPSGLFNLNFGAKYKAHRTAALPAFHPELIASFQEVMTAEAERFVASLPRQTEVLVEERLFLTTARTFCRSVVLSDEPTNEQEVAISRIIQVVCSYMGMINGRAFNPLLWPRWVWMLTARGRKVDKDFVEVRLLCRQLIADRDVHLSEVQEREEGDFVKCRKSLLDVLLLKHREDPSAFPLEDIVDELMNFLTAAIETSAMALSFAFKMLSIRADLQQKVYEEVTGVLGSGTDRRSVAAEDLPKLQYTERFLKETLRLLTPGTLTARQVHEDTELSGHVLPAGTTLVLNFFGLHRDPVTWPDPLRFDPDRFTAENSEGRHPYAFLPFSAGQRSCPGYSFAWAAMKTVLATVVRDFAVEPADDGLDDHAKFKLYFNVSLKIKGGVRVKFTPHSEKSR